MRGKAFQAALLGASMGVALCSCAGGVGPARDPGDLLTDLTRPMDGFRAARVSSHDRSGGNADALSNIRPGQTAVLADLQGPGMITHIWFTIAAEKYHGRTLVLRVYWDDEPDPSVLTPVNDFFCMGHGMEAEVRSLPIVTTATGRARNCFFKMPFNKRARIEIANEGLETVGAFYYYIDYRIYEKPFRDPAYFHARYRQEYPAAAGGNYLICSAAGRGHYVGTVFSIESHSKGWWGEGDDRFFVDGEATPSLHGTGSEDYLCDAWGVWPGDSLFYGTSIHEGSPYTYPKATRYTSYRFHIADPIPFRKSLRLEIEHYGAGMRDGRTDGFLERFDNLSSVAYWYQTEPHAPMDPLPPADLRLPDAAVKEKRMLEFQRKAAEPLQTAESVEVLRRLHAALVADTTWKGRVNEMNTRLARAELAAGNQAAARKLLGDSLRPFIHRSVWELLAPVAGRLDLEIGSTTPLLVPWEDGADRVETREDRPCVVTDGASGRSHVYFAFSADSPLHGMDRTAAVRVTYYSEGRPNDAFAIEYDSAYSRDIPGRYRRTEVIEKPERTGWFTAVVECPRALFDGGQNGAADFRITNLEDGEECVGAVELVDPSTR